MISDCTALILAGGSSRRMGQDKAMLDLHGKSLLQHVEGAVRSVFPQIILSVRDQRVGMDIPQVKDGQGQSGPLAGLLAGMMQADTPWVFAVACDMPFISSGVIEALAHRREGHQAVVPVVHGHPQPLAAFYAISALPQMQLALESGDLSLRGMLQRLDVCLVNESELRAYDPQLRSFFDLDTPQEYQAALK